MFSKIFGIFKIFKIFKNFQNFENFSFFLEISNFLKISIFFEILKFWKVLEFLKFLKFWNVLKKIIPIFLAIWIMFIDHEKPHCEHSAMLLDGRIRRVFEAFFRKCHYFCSFLLGFGEKNVIFCSLGSISALGWAGQTWLGGGAKS